MKPTKLAQIYLTNSIKKQRKRKIYSLITSKVPNILGLHSLNLHILMDNLHFNAYSQSLSLLQITNLNASHRIVNSKTAFHGYQSLSITRLTEIQFQRISFNVIFPLCESHPHKFSSTEDYNSGGEAQNFNSLQATIAPLLAYCCSSKIKLSFLSSCSTSLRIPVRKSSHQNHSSLKSTVSV